MAGLRYTIALSMWLVVTYTTVNGQFFTAPINNVVIPLDQESVTVSCPVTVAADMVDNIQWFDAVNATMVATGDNYPITNTGSYYCQVTERRGVYRSNTFFVYKTGFADNFSVHPKNFTLYSDTARVAFECRINTFVATEDDNSRLSIVWEGSDDPDGSFTELSDDTNTFSPLPGYSIFVMDGNLDTLPGMLRCQAMLSGNMVVATSEVAYIVNTTEGLGSTSGPPDNRTILLSPSDKTLIEMDTAAFVCIPANTSIQATWSDHSGSFTGANNFYLIIENVEQNTTVTCTVDGETKSAFLLVQEVPMLLENMMLSEITAAREGTTVTLQCSPVMTDPAPMITWLVDGIVDPQTTESFTTATVNESAIYQCLVEASFTPSTNRVGLPPSTSIISSTLVDCVPAITLTVTGATDHSDEGDVYNVMSGSSFSITCMLSCPTTTGVVMWRQNDMIISTSTGTSTSEDFSVEYMRNDNEEITSSVLTRTVAEPSDSAMYQCATMVQTTQSNDTADIFVYVVPDITQGPVDMASKVGESVTFTCNASGVPLPDITWSSDSDNTLDQDDDGVTITDNSVGMMRQSQLTLMNLEDIDFQSYTCTAENEFGSDDVTVILGIVAVITQGPVDMASKVGESVTFTCNASGVPLPDITWSSDSDDTLDQDDDGVTITDNPVGMMRQSQLTLMNLEDIDFQSYTCTAENEFGSDDVTVILGMEVVITQAPMETTQLLGGSVMFTCVATGIPLPTITWSSDNLEMIMPSNTTQLNDTTIFSEISINNIDMEDFVNYTCSAVNGFNTVRETAALINATIPMITVPPEDAVVLLNGEVTFTCTAIGVPAPIITWSNEDNNVIDATTNESMDTTTTSTLTLTNLTSSYFNQSYTCTASNEHGMTNRSAYLTEGMVPNIIEQPEDALQLMGRDVSFRCTAFGIPRPNITWMFMDRNNAMNELTSTSSEEIDGGVIFAELNLTAITTEDFGVYTCVATNDFGDDMEMADLEQGNEVMIITPPQNRSAAVFENVTFECTATGNRRPSITWMQQDGTEPRGTISTNPSENSITSTLTIINITSSDFTSYFCRAENIAIDNIIETIRVVVFANFILYRAVVPNAPMNVMSESVTSRMATITWQNGAPPNPANPPIIEYTIFLNDSSEGTAQSTMIILDGLIPFTSYTVSIVARNRIGYSTMSQPHQFTTMEEAPGAAPQDVVAQSPMIGTIELSWNPPPSDRHYGIITGYFITYKVVDSSGNPSSLTVSRLSTTIMGLMSNTMYEVTIAAVNGAGTSMINVSLLIRTLPEVVPNAPINVMSESVTSRMATITWQDGTLPNPVHPPIIDYTISLNDSSEYTAQSTMIILDGLIPFTSYTVSVVATNIIGNSVMSQSHQFTTLEEAPGAAPQDVIAQSPLIGIIELSWNPPPSDRHYGIITGYFITYKVVDSSGNPSSLTVSRLSTTIMGLMSNTMYEVTIAAVNGAGTSMISASLLIRTIPAPPAVTDIILPTVMPSSENIGTTSITLFLPNSTVPFSHAWVVAVRLSSKDSDVVNMDTNAYFNRTSFKTYLDALDDEPYIVAEIDASNYPVTFALGDNSSTAAVSDFPILDYNGPLMEGKYYSIFVRFFSPQIPEVRAKRNTMDDRQYSVFTTTSFLPAVSTAITQLDEDDGNDTAVIVGAIVGGLVALIIIVVVVLIVVLFVYRHWDGKLGPPPSRAGSKRFRDEDKPFHADDALELKPFEPNEARHPIAVQEFENHVKVRHRNSDNLFADEYELINIKSPRLSHEATSQAVNIAKNRYANINAYDQTRVRLMPYEGVDGSDYINANYIDGYKKKNAYIATQGPLPNTTEDFWRMVWEQETYTIVMLTNLMEKARVKCHQYWPQVGTVSYGNFTVTLIDSMEVANYCVRTLRLAKSDGEKNDETREVKQFHYTSWPDFGVPEHPSPIITFMRRIAQNKQKSAGPVVIHCSAGVGRTGTLVTIQSMLEMIIDTGTLDIFNFVLGLRRQRSFMVQTEKQYIFIHDTILEAIKVGNTQIEVMNLRKKLADLGSFDAENDQSGIESEFGKLGDLEQVDTSQFSAATAGYNQNKNRFPHILPYDKHRVKLLMYPGIEGSDYINATFLDGYHQRDQYIITQGPLQNTVGDFWRMIWEYKVSCVAMLCQLQEKGVDHDQSYKYWPELSQVLHFADILIETNAEKTMGGYVMREISITNSKVNESRTVNQFQYLDWQEDRCPNSASSVIDMIGWLTKMQYHRGGGPVVIHDCASVGRSATFCALKIVVEQVKTEGIIDVFYTVHTMRIRQPLSVRQIGQYHFIYNAVAEFLDSFDHYANFNDYKAH